MPRKVWNLIKDPANSAVFEFIEHCSIVFHQSSENGEPGRLQGQEFIILSNRMCLYERIEEPLQRENGSDVEENEMDVVVEGENATNSTFVSKDAVCVEPYQSMRDAAAQRTTSMRL